MVTSSVHNLVARVLADNRAVEVTGALVYRLADFHQGVLTALRQETYWFRVISDGERWFIRTEPVTNQMNTFDYCEAAFDGTNQYFVVSLESWVEDQKALGRPVGRNTAWGVVLRQPVPTVGTHHEVALLWLAYASAAYLGGLTDSIIHCPSICGLGPGGIVSALDDYRIRVRVVPGPGNLPTQVTFLETNVPRSDYACWPPGQWWTNGVFSASDYTNAGRFTVPLRASFRAFYPHWPLGSKEGTFVEDRAYQINAAAVRLVPTPAAWRPELPHPTSIGDLRFMRDKHRPIRAFHYLAQGKWYSDAEVKGLPEYRKAAGLAPSRVSAAAAVRLLVLVVLLSGPAVYLVLRKRQTEEGQ